VTRSTRVELTIAALACLAGIIAYLLHSAFVEFFAVLFAASATSFVVSRAIFDSES
jgi:hypothetical protein